MKTFLTFTTGLGAAVLAWWAFNLAIPEPGDQVPASIAVMGTRQPATELLGAHLNAPVVGGNSVTLLENGDEIFPAMLKSIREAQDTVNFLTYVYWTGDIAVEFSDALADACRRGVETRILLDAFGAGSIDSKLVTSMEDAGCKVAWFHPFSWFHVRHYNGRTHRKVLVVDGKEAFTGGVGIAQEWSGNGRRPKEWRDDHFSVRGPVVNYLQGAFAENWVTASEEVIAGERFFPEVDPAGDVTVVPIVTSPRGDRSVIAFAYWVALRDARETVDIATPYFVPDDAMIETLKQTAERGVRVRLLLPGDQNDSNLVRWTSLALYPGLIEAGVEVYEYQPAMMHTKLLLADGNLAIFGSANFDNRSFELNDEVVLVTSEASLGAELQASFDADIEHSSRIEAGGVETIGWWRSVLGTLGLLVREQL